MLYQLSYTPNPVHTSFTMPPTTDFALIGLPIEPKQVKYMSPNFVIRALHSNPLKIFLLTHNQQKESLFIVFQ
jgi:hypothetical protein